MTARHPYILPARRELNQWPGVTAKHLPRAKHRALMITYNNRTRMIIYPTSPSDGVRGVKNHIGEIRAACVALGARKTARRKATRVRRAKVAAVAPEAVIVPTETRLSRDPWAALTGWASRMFGGRL